MLHGRYQILGILGQGGMGCVYLAYDTSNNNHLVAVKEMLQGNLSSRGLQKAQERFSREAEMLRKLTPHPHIPTFYDHFSEQGRSYLVMDYIEGETLQAKLQQASDGRLPLEQALNYALQLCEVLSYLHQQPLPVIFRDLKPGNVMITSNDKVFLIDFGIARHFKPGQLTDTEVIGSKGFIAPELSWGAQPEPRSDLYSLGALLHYCLTGRHPIMGKPTMFVFSSIRQDNLQVPVALDALILKMVATLPEQRPTSVDEVFRELSAIYHWLSTLTMPVQGNVVQDMGPLYNPKVAQQVQLLINWSQLNKLPGRLGRAWASMLPFFALVGAWTLATFLPWCRTIGVYFIQSIQKAPDLTRLTWRWSYAAGLALLRGAGRGNVSIRRQPVGRQKRPRPRPAGSVTVWRKTQRFLRRLWQLRHSPYAAPFVGILSLTTVGSLELLLRLRLSPVLALFVLALSMLFVSLMIGMKHKDRFIQAILSTVALVMLLVCGILLFQGRVMPWLNTITFGELVACGLLALAFAVLFRPTEQDKWLEHIAVSIALCCSVFLLYALCLSGLTSNSIIEIAVTGGLAIFAIPPLFVLKRTFAVPDHLAKSIAAGLCIVLLIVSGDQSLQAGSIFIPLPAPVLRWGLIIVLGAMTFLSWYLHHKMWGIINRLSLVLVVISCALLFQYASLHSASFVFPPIMSLFDAKLLDPAHLNLSIMDWLTLLAILLLYRCFRGNNFLYLDMMIILALASIIMLLPVPSAYHSVPSLAMNIERHLSPIAHWIVLFGMVGGCAGIVCSIICHLINQRWLSRAIVVIDWLIVWLGYVLLSTSTIVCLFFLWNTAGASNPFHLSDPGARQWVYALLLVPAALIACAAVGRTIWSLDHGLRWLSGARSEMSYQAEEAAFDRVDQMIVLGAIIFLAFLWWLQTSSFASPSVLQATGTHDQIALWVVSMSLIVAICVSFFWLREPFEQRLFRAIRAILFVSLCFALLAIFDLLLSFLRPLLIAMSLVALICLIQGTLLASWAKDPM